MWNKWKKNNTGQNDFSLNDIDEGRIGATDDALDSRREIHDPTEKKKMIAGAVAIVCILGGYGYYVYNHYSKKEAVITESSEFQKAESSPTVGDPFGLDGYPRNPIPIKASEEQSASSEVTQTDTVDEEALKQAALEKEMMLNRYNSGIFGDGSNGDTTAPNSESPQSNLPPELLAMYQAAGIQLAGSQNGSGNSASTGNNYPNNLAGRFASNGSMAPSAKASYKGNRAFLIQQGKFIDATLQTDVVSDLPGTIVAIVSNPVYGEEGTHELIPAGTRLFGQYSSDIKYGQAVIDAVWNRAILPSGIEISLDSPSTDTVGVQGLNGGKVNNHFWRTYGNAALISLLGTASSNSGVSKDDRNNSKSQYRSDMSNKMSEMAQNQLEQRANLPPTITVPRATRIKVMVAKDLDFSTLLESE